MTIFVLWVIQQIFEMNGGRADSMSNGNLMQGIFSAMIALWKKMYGVNYWFAGVILIILVLTIALAIWNWRKPETKQDLCEMGQVFLALALVMIYLILLCGKSSSGYIARCDVLVGPAFFGFLLVFMGVISITKRFPEINCVMPILIFALYCETNTMGNTFYDVNMGGLTAETCIEIDNDIIEQVKTAVDQGAYSMKQ